MKEARAGLTSATTLMLAAAPWALCVLASSGLRVVLTFLVTCMVLALGGLALSRLLVPTLPLDSWLLLSLPVGILWSSFVTSTAVRLGTDLRVPAAILILTSLVGAWIALRRGAEIAAMAGTVLPSAASSLIILFSAAICVVYFVPSLLWDGTFRPNGSFGWLYIDCQWYMATTTSILRGGAPPDMPGLAGAPLWYHYGRFAVAAMVHRVSLCSVADSLFAVVGGVGRIGLVLSTVALGRALGGSQRRRFFPGLLAAFGVFFVGWISWPLTAQGYPFSIVSAKLSALSALHFPPEHWEPFQHILHSSSLPWGAIGIFVVLSVLLETAATDTKSGVGYGLPLMAALVVPLNGVAALGAAGVSWLELAFRHHRRLSGLAAISLGVAATGFSCWFFLRPVDLAVSRFTIDPDPRPQLYDLFMYFFLGHGVLLLGLDWLRSFPRTAASRALAIVTVGFLSFTVFLENRDWNDQYGIRFVTMVLVAFAMARIGSWIGDDLMTLARRTLRRLGTSISAAAGLFALLSLAVAVLAGPGTRGVALIPAAAVAAAGGGLVLVWLSRRGSTIVAAGSAVVGSLFLFQTMAWVPVFVVKGLQKAQQVKVSAGEVEGLVRLKNVSPPGSLCVTNHHEVPHRSFRPARSYFYTALSERAFVLEGWEFREMSAPGFQEARDLSEEVFATRDPEMLCRSLRDRGVDFVVARPGTDVQVSEDECSCIQRVPDCGTLTIYRVQ